MTDQAREAMQLALTALNRCNPDVGALRVWHDATELLTAALATKAEQVPAPKAATVVLTPEQVSAVYLVLWRGRVRPDATEKRPAYGWMEPALQEVEKVLKSWHSHFHDRQFNAMNRQFFGDGRLDLPVSPAPPATE